MVQMSEGPQRDPHTPHVDSLVPVFICMFDVVRDKLVVRATPLAIDLNLPPTLKMASGSVVLLNNGLQMPVLGLG